MELDSSRGLRNLLQLDERVPASIYPTFENLPTRHVLPIKGLNDPNYPQQLHSRSLKPNYSSPIPPILDIIQACGSSTNTTSHRSASSSHVSQWRSVARWETNGADPLPSVRCEKKDYDPDRAAYELARQLGCLDERAARYMNLSFMEEKESKCSSTASESEMELGNGQIPTSKPCPETDAELFPPSNVALFPLRDSHLYDISANPPRSPLSFSLSTPPPAALFSSERYFGEPRVVSFMAHPAPSS